MDVSVKNPSSNAPTTNTRSLADLNCLIIGAASGIGAATATLLRNKTAAVVEADLATASWKDQPEGARRLEIDVSDPVSVDSAITAAIRTMGRVDVVVNTAGILGTVQPSTAETLDDFERLVRINLTGAFLVSKAVLPHMIENGFGRLVHFASTAGKEGVARMTGYSASKAGVMGLVKALAKEYATSNITINAIAPGKVDTPLVRDQPPSTADLERIPMNRLGSAPEAAALIEYIVSPSASYTTGFVYDLSGGRASY